MSNRIVEALMLFCNGTPPNHLAYGDDFDSLSDDESLELQDWCASNAKYKWMTGYAIMAAALTLVVVSDE